jgi:hypothetical protein
MALSLAAAAGVMLCLAAPRALLSQAPPSPIRDNSFLVEEAYNQDGGVVQHVGTFAIGRMGGWAAGVDEEWPLGGMRDQLSLSLAVLDASGGTNFGDIELGYRRQLVGGPESRFLVAPRLSALLLQLEDGPEGSTKGLGAQAAVPMTAVLTPSIVTHWNLSVTLGPFRPIASAGASVVWLVSPTVNLLVEGVWVGQDGTPPVYVLNPGARFAVNAGALQIVPGISFPMALANQEEADAVLLYLSFEHPLGSAGSE